MMNVRHSIVWLALVVAACSKGDSSKSAPRVAEGSAEATAPAGSAAPAAGSAVPGSPTEPAGSAAPAAPAAASGKRAAEQVAIDWLTALAAGDAKKVEQLTAVPFGKSGSQLGGCNAKTAADVATFTTCVGKDELVVEAIRGVTLTEPGLVTEIEGAGPDEYKDFLKEYKKELGALPADQTRVLVAIPGDGHNLAFLVTVKDGKVTAGVFGGNVYE